jgi:hypothetical protein
MTTTTTLNLDGAELTVETSALFRAWFERHLGQPGKPSFAVPAARPGERYLSSIIEPSGRVRHTFLMPGDKKLNWDDGMAWAKGLGGDLPDRIEQAMLLAFMPEEFEKEAYWSNTQHAGVSGDAWFQLFDYGGQYNDIKSCECRVRRVRREFNDSVI